MKLRNKKTGEIRELPDGFFCGDNLKKICEEWEDYEEPKDNDYWYIDDFGRPQFSSEILDEVEEHPNNWMARKLFGNYFGTREEAEKAVEKLKAWKRLKDKGFKIVGVRGLGKVIDFDIPEPYNHIGFDEYEASKDEKEFYDDLLLLFGGEE